MYNRLIECFENFIIIFENQFGFRKTHMSFMAHVVLSEKNPYQIFKNRDVTIGVNLDLYIVSYIVDHTGLLGWISYHWRKVSIAMILQLFIQPQTLHVCNI